MCGHKVSATIYFYIGWNMRPERKFFLDKRVRKAMTYALDRKSFVEKAGYGLAIISTGPFLFKSWAYNPRIDPWPFDLDKAAELLHLAGWVDQDGDGILDRAGLKFKFELLLPSGAPTFVQLASIIQANLKNLSIEVIIRVLDWSVYLDKTHRGEFDACLGGWLMGIDPDPYSMWHSSQIGAGNNDIGYVNEEVDRLLIAGRSEFERQKRQKIYWKIHKIIHEEQPCTFIYTKMETYILSKRIQNYEISPFGLFDFFPGQLAWSFE
ncbi:ABC transporter substrate-binding protein [candidate division CSSED10-310 bacterium]|uniref:ABC transporter substrate-binding protein n=1 Tax=candidate division CSSED10-310 bacterium TaxID=2855610 RepID=A0ABV6YYK8_UNCC1